MPDQNVIGAIDIGSNAIRMICARLTEDYRIEELEKNRTPIRLGEDVFRMGYITEERIEQLLATIKVYQKTCLLYTSPSPRDSSPSRMPSSA